MNQPAVKTNKTHYAQLIAAILLVVAFFIPWVSWDKITVTGADLPLGNFFSISDENFRLANPFPQTDLVTKLLWLTPLLAFVVILTAIFHKRNALTAILTGFSALCAVTIYILFSRKLADLGVNYLLEPGSFLTIAAAAGLILTAATRLWLKPVFIIAGPLLIWTGFGLAEDYLMEEKFGNTANVKADYTVNALDLIKEFQANDSIANAKYIEKIVKVNGAISAIETPNDSTVNIKFIDTTSGSYVIFPFEGKALTDVQNLKPEENISVKGSCSGAIYSEILGAWFISFKRSVLDK